jgi:hypothetical protein
VTVEFTLTADAIDALVAWTGLPPTQAIAEHKPYIDIAVRRRFHDRQVPEGGRVATTRADLAPLYGQG